MLATSIMSSCVAALLLLVQQAPQRLPAPEYIARLEAERRVAGLQIPRVVQTLRAQPGQRVADIGSGSGLFTRPLAQAVGSGGIVYAIDIDPDLLKHVEKTSRDKGLSNVRTVLAAENDPKIPKPVDLIVIIDTLHHINNRGTYLAGLKRYLKPGGRIAIIDFSESWPEGHEAMKYTFSELEELMRAGGYTRTEKADFLANNFFAVYSVSQSSRRYINLPGRATPLPFSDGVLVGNTLYLAGRLGTDPKTGQIPPSVDDEIRFMLDGFKAVLAEAGMTMNNLVSVQIFCPDLTLYDKFNAAYRTYFSQNFPARAFIGSGPLLRGAHFEMVAVAAKD
jgi:enamine deaminase RidA (YjgF/YER057c/UK114 family)